MIANAGNGYFEPVPNIESLHACYLSIRRGWAKVDLRRRWQTPILLADIDRCERWLEQKGKREEPPVCTNSALASLIFPVDDVIETEGLPFQITFLFAGIVRCNRTATVRESVDSGTMEHPSER
jgi:hypothetical protein